MAFHPNPATSTDLLPPSLHAFSSSVTCLVNTTSSHNGSVKYESIEHHIAGGRKTSVQDVISSMKEGIGLDESSSQASSISIPSSVSLRGKIAALIKTTSLPSSPTKAGPCQSLAESRAEILMMKDSSCRRRSTSEGHQAAASDSPDAPNVTCEDDVQRSSFDDLALLEYSGLPYEQEG